jgi:hypothetical protein
MDSPQKVHRNQNKQKPKAFSKWLDLHIQFATDFYLSVGNEPDVIEIFVVYGSVEFISELMITSLGHWYVVEFPYQNIVFVEHRNVYCHRF